MAPAVTRAKECGAIAKIFGILGVGLLKEVEGGIVILTGFCFLTVLEQRIGGLGVEAGTGEAEDGERGEERKSEGGSCMCGSAYSRSLSAAVHRTPRRLKRSGFAGPLWATLAAPDANPSNGRD